MNVYVLDRWTEGLIETVEVREIDSDGRLLARSETRGEISVWVDEWCKTVDEARRVANQLREERIEQLSDEVDRLRSLTMRLDTELVEDCPTYIPPLPMERPDDPDDS